MRRAGRPWYKTTWFLRAARTLGIAEMGGGLVLIVSRHDEAQGYALLAIGAATFGSMPLVSRAPSEERS
jgi:hypothetical protein